MIISLMYRSKTISDEIVDDGKTLKSFSMMPGQSQG